MKNQALFSSKDKKLKCSLLQVLFGAYRVENIQIHVFQSHILGNVYRYWQT